MVMPEGEIPLHQILPLEKQDALVRLDGILDEMLVRHDFPEDVREIIASRIDEWVKKWGDKGVHRSHTFAEFHNEQIPGFVKEALYMNHQAALRRRASDNSLIPPGRS
jgi:hypothetical protein|tara:strand:- start:310 stop:633 length:324 start_codon:yes stop_codon:yes gene_type:complete